MTETQKRSAAMKDLLSIWNESNAGKRRELADRLLAAKFVYADAHAPGPIDTPQGFLSFIETFRSNLPDASVDLIGEPQNHNSFGRFHFAVSRAGRETSRGAFFATFGSDGRFSQIIGFVD
jgi:hypothetical protein